MVGEESWEEEIQQVRLARKRRKWYKTRKDGFRVGGESKEFVEEYSSGRNWTRKIKSQRSKFERQTRMEQLKDASE